MKPILKNYEFPTIAWECYLAFDSGEYCRQEDSKSVDPAEKYIKPLIEELLKKRNLISYLCVLRLGLTANKDNFFPDPHFWVGRDQEKNCYE